MSDALDTSDAMGEAILVCDAEGLVRLQKLLAQSGVLQGLCIPSYQKSSSLTSPSLWCVRESSPSLGSSPLHHPLMAYDPAHEEASEKQQGECDDGQTGPEDHLHQCGVKVTVSD